MNVALLILVSAIFCIVYCKPLIQENEDMENRGYHRMTKRFTRYDQLRVKRSLEEECEKLQLCKLHARSTRNFFAAYELYFVNKENARLWDHQTHTVADCERRYSCYR